MGGRSVPIRTRAVGTMTVIVIALDYIIISLDLSISFLISSIYHCSHPEPSQILSHQVVVNIIVNVFI